MKWLLLAVLLPAQAMATIYIFTPGQSTKVINKTDNGYVVTEMDSGNTQVMDIGGITSISGGGRPTSFIMDGGAIGRSMNGVMPALTPNGAVEPVVPMPIEFTE